MAQTVLPVLDQVTKRYARRGHVVLNAVTLHIQPGSVTIVLGSNGSGKSTLLGVIARTVRPSSGAVRPLGPMGYAPERLPARLPFSANDYLLQMGRIRGLGSNATRMESDAFFGRLALRPGPHVPIESLSKGNRQKVNLAQAFLGSPSAILLDEPTSGLDQAATTTLHELINEARSRGTSVIITRQALAMDVPADQMIRVADGKLHSVAQASASQPSHVLVDAIAPSKEDQFGVGLPEGVTSIDTTSGGHMVTLHVNEAALDAILYRLIGAGWSIREVRRIDGLAR